MAFLRWTTLNANLKNVASLGKQVSVNICFVRDDISILDIILLISKRKCEYSGTDCTLGIILFTVIGLGNVLTAIPIVFKSKYQGYVSSVFSWALVIWIIVQCIMLRTIVSLHIIFLVIGLVEAIFSTIILFKQCCLFPTNIILRFTTKLKINLIELNFNYYVIFINCALSILYGGKLGLSIRLISSSLIEPDKAVHQFFS